MDISEKDIQESLMEKHLKKWIIEELGKQIVGEKKGIDTILSCFLGSKVANNHLTSFNLSLLKLVKSNLTSKILLQIEITFRTSLLIPPATFKKYKELSI